MQPSSCLLILFTSLVSSVLLAGTGRKSTVAKEEGDSVVGVTVATPASASSKMSPTISISNTLPEGGNKAEQGVMEEEEFIPVICLRHASPANAINDVQSPTRRRRCLTEMSPQQLEEALIRLHLEAGKVCNFAIRKENLSYLILLI